MSGKLTPSRASQEMLVRAHLARKLLLDSSRFEEDFGMRKLTSLMLLVVAAQLCGCVATARNPEGAVAKPSPRIVAGDVEISNQTSLRAFENLEIVTGTLTIAGNTRLRSLDGLERLRAVRQLVIKENLALEDTQALAGLRNARSVVIQGNPRLESVRGFESLKALDRLIVTDNGIFCTTGFGGLTRVGQLVVTRNARLLSLRGFSRLESAGSVVIADNPRIVPETGFLSDLRRVSGAVEVRRNAGIEPRHIRLLERRIQRPITVAAR
ncbi:MAG TPA: hypothetical protein VFZ53_20275 [Polyangiaceae bacterium]